MSTRTREPAELSVAIEDIRNARDTLAGLAHFTPIVTSPAADQRAGARLFFKCENLQRTGAFKFRGAYNALSKALASTARRGVVTFSSGNHAQAIALSAQLLGVPALIVMPEDAPASKVSATQGYGAEIVWYDRYRKDREQLAKALASERGFVMIPPYDHPDVIAGQGTVAMEMFDQRTGLDLLVVPLGGGGLLAGCAIAAKAINPECRLVGVEPEAGNDGQQSLRANRIVHIDTPRTIADGAQTQHLGEHTFPILRQLVDDIVTVSDDQLIDAMRFCRDTMDMVVEPTGCLAAAAVLSGRLDLEGRSVGIVVSGGNIDSARFAQLAGPKAG
jgi:threo-3-hydroxy-L-aspartate ammonia-lyase